MRVKLKQKCYISRTKCTRTKELFSQLFVNDLFHFALLGVVPVVKKSII